MGHGPDRAVGRDGGLAVTGFRPAWREAASAAFDLETNASVPSVVPVRFGDQVVPVYANANLSVYVRQPCNARCPFCVEELRPAARGVGLAAQRRVVGDDAAWLGALERALVATAPVGPTLAVTGGEPSHDPSLPAILRLLAAHGTRRRSITTNGSGLWVEREGQPVIDWITSTGTHHLNLSRAHPDHELNARLMRMDDGLGSHGLRAVLRRAQDGGTRPRLSCVLLRHGVADLDGVLAYLDFAADLGVDNVIFRQLMRADGVGEPSPVLRYSDRHRVALRALLDRWSQHPEVSFVRQVMGYYYYVEVWRYRGIDVVFEEADLDRLQAARARWPGVAFELVFHPDGALCSTWQPWDGRLMESCES